VDTPRRLLTPKQEAFAQAIGAGANQSDAYRLAYNTRSMMPKYVWDEASKLAHHPVVTQRINEIRRTFTKHSIWNKARVVAELVKNLEKAQQHGRIAAANQALRQIAKIEGLL